MFNRFLPVLLATSIVACPWLCKGGAACCRTERALGVRSCCDACHETETAESPDRGAVPNNQNSSSPEKSGGCICNGAVVEDASPQKLVVEGCNWIALPAADQLTAVVSYQHQNALSRTPLPDDGMNPGRALRCLMMSYLC